MMTDDQNWWYTKPDFPDTVSPEEILEELTFHWMGEVNRMRSYLEMLTHEQSERLDDETKSKIVEEVLSIIAYFDTYVQKSRRYLAKKS